MQCQGGSSLALPRGASARHPALGTVRELVAASLSWGTTAAPSVAGNQRGWKDLALMARGPVLVFQADQGRRRGTGRDRQQGETQGD